MNEITCKFEIPTTDEWTSVEIENGKYVAYYNNPAIESPRFRIERFRNADQAVAAAARWALDRTAFVLGGIEAK